MRKILEAAATTGAALARTLLRDDTNWLRTIPGKGWFTILRLYGPLQAWFDHTWRPTEIQPTA